MLSAILVASLGLRVGFKAPAAQHPRTAAPVAKIGSVDPTELAKKYCLVVVGGGPAGVAGALKGAYMGKRVLLIDKPKAAPAGGGLDFFFGGPLPFPPASASETRFFALWLSSKRTQPSAPGAPPSHCTICSRRDPWRDGVPHYLSRDSLFHDLVRPNVEQVQVGDAVAEL